MKRNWKTTTCGILSAIAAGITLVAIPMLDADPATLPNWEGLIVAIATAAGLLVAADATKSHE